jgi:hypothetical protein
MMQRKACGPCAASSETRRRRSRRVAVKKNLAAARKASRRAGVWSSKMGTRGVADDFPLFRGRSVIG